MEEFVVGRSEGGNTFRKTSSHVAALKKQLVFFFPPDFNIKPSGHDTISGRELSFYTVHG